MNELVTSKIITENELWRVTFEKWKCPHIVKCWTVYDNKNGLTALMTDDYEEVIEVLYVLGKD